MKYLVAVNHCFSDNPSGSSRVAWDIAGLARDAGHEVTMICQSPTVANGQSEVATEEGIVVVRVGRPNHAIPPLLRREFKSVISGALRKYLGAYHPDVVHIHSLYIGDAIMSALGPRYQYIATIHSPVVPESILNWQGQGFRGKAKILLGGAYWLRSLQNRVLQACSRIHVLSEYTKREMRVYCPRLPLAEVIPHWRRADCVRIDSKLHARTALGWPASTPVLFSLRRMVPRMGHAVAIRAVAPLLEEFDARLVLAGTGPLRGDLEALARSLPGGDRIEFTGRVSDSQLRLMYCAADLFLLPTMALECFGLIILEAFSFGCPVLATSVGAIPEAVSPIMPDFLVQPGDVKAFRSKARDFLSGNLVAPSADSVVDFVDASYGVRKIGPRLMQFIDPHSCFQPV